MGFKEKRKLGKTDLMVSRLGLAGGYGISSAAVEKAFHEYDINYFYWSTPRKSGMRDALLNLVKNHREQIVIVLQSYDHLGITVKRSVTKGLKTLGIDHADVVLLGWHNRFPTKKILSESMKLKESGLVKYIGMSGHNRRLFGKMADEGDSPIDIFMLRYNAAHTGAETEIFPYLKNGHRPGITAYTATSWGKLLNPKKLTDDLKPMSASDCYRFALSNDYVDLCMTGPRTEQEMLQGFKALELGPLSSSEMDRCRKIGAIIHG